MVAGKPCDADLNRETEGFCKGRKLSLPLKPSKPLTGSLKGAFTYLSGVLSPHLGVATSCGWSLIGVAGRLTAWRSGVCRTQPWWTDLSSLGLPHLFPSGAVSFHEWHCSCRLNVPRERHRGFDTVVTLGA
uniref:Uncharacterized protein n=1 Tax=Oryza punctata TaxID=4537 RepID=A0A0E0LI75_ORYPU